MCPYCKRNEQQVKAGKTSSGNQRYLCKICGRKYTPSSSAYLKSTLRPQEPVYVQPVRQYRGVGILRHQPLLEPTPCTFAVYQLPDGDIRLRCEANLFTSWKHLEMGPRVALHLEATTEEDLSLRIDGPALLSSHTTHIYSDKPPDPVVIRYLVQGDARMEVGNQQWSGEATVRFALTNFKFVGTEVEEIEPGPSGLNTLRLNISNTLISIRKVRDYESRLDRLEVIGDSNITCEAQTIIKSPNDLSRIQEIMDNLCRLLSIASGTLVSWLYFEIFSGAGVFLYAAHRNSIARNYVSQPLIDPRQRYDVKYFVESTYDRYVELLATHRMIQVVHAFTEARNRNFLETRGLIILSLVEYLTDPKGDSTFIPNNLYEQGRDEFKILVSEAARKAYPGIDNDTRETLATRCIANFQTLRRKLKQFCAENRVPVSRKEIEGFIKNRDALAHRAAFAVSDESSGLNSMMRVLDRMILRLLDYSGPYLNCITWEREELKPSN